MREAKRIELGLRLRLSRFLPISLTATQHKVVQNKPCAPLRLWLQKKYLIQKPALLAETRLDEQLPLHFCFGSSTRGA